MSARVAEAHARLRAARIAQRDHVTEDAREVAEAVADLRAALADE